MPPSRLKCPICKDVLLGDGVLDSNLVAHPCAQCGGQWIAPKDYWKWLEGRKVVTPDPPTADNPIDLPVKQTETPKFCPDCGRFLGRHKVGHGVAFSIDRCGTCGGFWLDAGELAAQIARFKKLTRRGASSQVNQVQRFISEIDG